MLQYGVYFKRSRILTSCEFALGRRLATYIPLLKGNHVFVSDCEL